MPKVSSHGHEIFYLRAGRGPAIVFVHGTGGNATLWLDQFAAFTDRYTCIAFDHRGFARSSGPPEIFEPSYFADDVRAILDAEGLSSCVIVCSSLGGWTGAKFALQYPEKLAGLVICNSTAAVNIPSAIRACEDSRSLAAAEGAVGVAVSPDFIRDQPLKVYLFEQVQSATSAEHQLTWLVVYDRIMSEQALISPAQVASIKCKTLHIGGTLDKIFPPDVIEDVAAQFADAEVVMMDGVAHCPWMEAPVAFNAIVQKFLSRIGWGG